MEYRKKFIVRFGDIDTAGIMYYPTILHQIHTVFEDFFIDTLDMHYSEILPEMGLPSVHLDTDFSGPLRFGDEVEVALTIPKIGKSSVVFEYKCYRCSDNVLCATLKATVVAVDLKEFKSIPLPKKYRDHFEKYSSP